MESPSYVKALLIRNGKKPAGRRVWSIDLETVWLPFFTATNTVGDTAIPSDALGAPLRLAYNPDGSVKFSKTGRAVTKVARDLSDGIRLVRENFTAGLQNYANMVITGNPEGYKAEVLKARQAGEPIITHDKAKFDEAIAKANEDKLAALLAEVEAEAKAKAKAKGKAKVKAEAEVKESPEPAQPEKELVPA